ncbi:malto-oligosyltrehalose trehalohydrolase [Loktanella sp. TSTF-M6]|uniref:Malto-oligosyltrehalose trehalohydrolase n=1 Tax=Loktanella gaetbuli TaxID=2881335 RepID=A0ABS8BYE1_9RHOB|nr:malto-oligosyltrehalose trehalohydrolase [Loktanella gaetbuli]MCB5200756.1 malto-oligosyltrehalose trehalohydrolase [Loktanella gaetbuli]
MKPRDQLTDLAHLWGARPATDTDWDFAIWSPDRDSLDLMLNGVTHPMTRDADGVFRARLPARAGDSYGYMLDGQPVPDPASRRQAGGVHDLSMLTRPPQAPSPWVGRDWPEAVICEIHIGTFTDAGTFQAAAEKLGDLAAVGINTVEVMPIAQFGGNQGWGYDGVLPNAVHPAYGTPQDFANFVAVAHDLGISVILDVVYNHFGPDGAYIHALTPAFFDHGRSTPWGPAVDFTQDPVRTFFFQNAAMCVNDFGVDGFRFDAVHQLVDPSPEPFFHALTGGLRAMDAGRPLHLIAEDERNLTTDRDAGRIDAQWNDDFHHAVHCLLTGESEGYYRNYAADPMADLTRALAEGQVEQGQPRVGASRGAPSGHLPASAFVNANQTHDQIGNRALGDRLITLAGAEAMRIAHALLLTAPYVPMLFQGEEIGSRTPFPFFCDFTGDLADAVRNGRKAEFADFDGFKGDLPDPLAEATRDMARPYAHPPEDAGEWSRLTARLLGWRATQVMPLVRTGGAQPARVRTTGTSSAVASWGYNGGHLYVAFHFDRLPDTPHLWPDTDARLTVGAPDKPFGFCTWTTPA